MRVVFAPSTNVCSNIMNHPFRRAALEDSDAKPKIILTHFAGARPLVGAAVTAAEAFFRSAIIRFAKITIGVAMKIDEYVPTIIPTTNANENPRNTGPPKINRRHRAEERQTAGQQRSAQCLID